MTAGKAIEPDPALRDFENVPLKEDIDRERAIFPQTVLDFIRQTQPIEWAKLEALHGDKTGEQILTDLCKWSRRRTS